MVTVGERKRRGFTLVELLIVVSIFAIMAAIAVPTMFRMGAFSRNEMQRTSRTVLSLLKAARTYAATYNVDTAVVYSLDNYVRPWQRDNSPGLAEPMTDSVTGEVLRVINAAAIMYRPTGLPSFNETDDYFVPAPRRSGNFQEFPGQMVMFLDDPETGDVYYRSSRPRFDSSLTDNADPVKVNRIGDMRMTFVHVILEGGPFVEPDGDLDSPYNRPEMAPFLAHRFTPEGRIVLSEDHVQLDSSGSERYTIYVGPSPSELPDVRLINPESGDTVNNLVMIPLSLYRSTGRVEIAS